MGRGVNGEEGKGQMSGEQGRGKNVEEEERRENKEEEEIVEKYWVEEAIGKRRQEGRKRGEMLEEERGWSEVEKGKEQDRGGALEVVKRIEA